MALGRFQTLSSKVLMAVSSACLVLFLGQWAVARSIILSSYAKLEEKQAVTDTERLASAVTDNLETLHTLSKDWAWWDDIYNFAQTGNPQFVASNLNADILERLALDLFVVVNLDSQIVYGKDSGLDGHSFADLPEGVASGLSRYTTRVMVAAPETGVVGYALIDGRPALLSVQQVLDSKKNGPVQGALVMGRFIDSEEIVAFAETTRLVVDAQPLQRPNLPAGFAQVRQRINKTGETTVVDIVDARTIAGYTVIPGISGQPGLLLKTQSDRDIYAQGQISLRYYFWSSLVVGVLFCGLMLYLLRSLILDRLDRLSHQVSQIGSSDRRDEVRIQLAGSDELSQLAHSVDWTLGQLRDRTVELEAARQAADAANRAKSAFLANMSHELRTPLNAVLGFAQILQLEPELTPQQRERLSIINHSGEHLLNLINDVLDMSKVEAGRLELTPERFDLRYLLETLEDVLSLRAEAKGINLVFDLADEVPPCLQADARKLNQVLLNLLSNAIKFTQQGTVRLAIHRVDAPEQPSGETVRLQFRVEDTGAGIAASELEQIFQPFAQTETGRQSQQGTGLGLSISQRFVELMGGVLTVTSTVGQGSVFTFELDLAIAAAVDAVPLVQRQVVGLASDQPAYRILVVDDRELNRKLMVELLRPIGFEVRTAEDGQAAVDQWQAWQPQLIWMDMRMPVMSGYDAVRHIRAAEPARTTVIIALTASTQEEERALVLAAGCDDFVRKPFKQETIFNKMAEYLGLRYRYATETPRHDPPVSDAATLEAMQQLSPAWLQRLAEAAIALNDGAIAALLVELPKEYDLLQRSIRAKISTFDFDQIVLLAERAIDSAVVSPPSV